MCVYAYCSSNWLRVQSNTAQGCWHAMQQCAHGLILYLTPGACATAAWISCISPLSIRSSMSCQCQQQSKQSRPFSCTFAAAHAAWSCVVTACAWRAVALLLSLAQLPRRHAHSGTCFLASSLFSLLYGALSSECHAMSQTLQGFV